MTRREFIAGAGVAAAGTAAPSFAVVAGGAGGGRAIVSHDAPPRNRHPYKDLDWLKAHQIKTTSHVHVKTQDDLDVLLKRGLGLITLSNYYPSAPWYPLSKMTENYWRVHHDFPVVVKGVRKDGPFDWNRIVGKWIGELPPELQKEYPFKEGGRLFKPLPDGVLEAPNAEHHNFFGDDGKRIIRLHINSIGSTFASGTFDQWQQRRFQTGNRAGYDFGSGENWRTAVGRMLDALVYPDGGGVTINHPGWSSHDRRLILDMLDHDQRVLGLEVIEGGVHNSEGYWDWVLSTGRQCFGFFVPDHAIRRPDGSFGVNVLVTPERTVRACMKAYREGNFYGAKRGLGELNFRRIAFDGKTVEAETDKPARFRIITGLGIVSETEGTSVKWTLEDEYEWSAPRETANVFVRVKACALDGSGEELYSQPYMLV